MKILKIISLFLLLTVVFVVAHIIYLYTLTPTESFTQDTFLQNATNKKALIIVAHDDDAAMFSGTTSMLAENGWDVSFLCFYTNQYRPEDVPIRKQEIKKVSEIQHFKDMNFVDFTMRRSLNEVEKPWVPIPYDDFSDSFYCDSLGKFVKDAILTYQPSVIFTLDNVIGGYGHPEHVLVGKTVVDICNTWKDSASFPTQRIYQNVWPESQSKRIMGDGGVYAIGKKYIIATACQPLMLK